MTARKGRPGDTIATQTADGKPHVWEVYAKRIEINKTAGEAKVMLQAEPVPGVDLIAATEAPPGTLTHRLIRRR